MTNCPNCGAPITGRICEYCGTVHWQDSPISDNAVPVSQKSAEVVIETVASGERVPVAIPLWLDDGLFGSCDEVQCTSINGPTLRGEPAVLNFTVCRFDGTDKQISNLAKESREYYVVFRDKESKRPIVENRVIGRIAIKGLGVNDGTLDISITAEGPVSSRYVAV